jgi:hypothetical protein
MRRHFTGDLWVDAHLVQRDERLAEARAIAAQRALRRGSRPPRRRLRRWLGVFLLAVAHRLLGSAPTSAASWLE